MEQPIPKTTAAAASPGPTSSRIMSVDALRGFDMFWIVGAESIVHALNHMAPNPAIGFLQNQLEHKDWAGFAFYDLIFPMFVFIMGVSIVFSLQKTLVEYGRAEAVKRICRRGILLFAAGVFYYGGFSNEWPGIRLLGVLQRIALCYFFAALLFCFLSVRGLIATAIGILIGYWALMTFIPIRDIQLSKDNLQLLAERADTTNAMVLFQQTTARVTHSYEPGKNLANHLDFQYLPGRKHDVYYDPEGMLSTLPAVATALLGIFAGLLLKHPRFAEMQRVKYLLIGGAAAVLLGFIWGLQFPVAKKIWTSSFVLVAGGYSAMLLGIFYYMVDVRKHQRWCQPFVWIGANALTVYLVNNLLNFQRVANRLAGGDVKNFLNASIALGFGELMIALLGVVLAILFCGYLYRKRLFIRL